MRIAILLISIALLTGSVNAQDRFLETNKSYDIAKISLIDNGSLKVKNLTFVNDTLLQYSVNAIGFKYNKEQRSTTNIKYIAVKNGSHAFKYGMIGGILGLLGGSLFITYQLVIADDPDKSDTVKNPGWLLVGSISGGAIGGALIGLCVPKWELIKNPDKKISFFILPKANLNYCGLGLTFNF